MGEEISADLVGMVKRIDERTALMLSAFDRHMREDREDFGKLRDLIADQAENAAFVTEVRGMAKEGKFFEPLRAAQTWKETQDTVKLTGLRVATGALLTAFVGLMWAGFADKIRELFH